MAVLVNHKELRSLVEELEQKALEEIKRSQSPQEATDSWLDDISELRALLQEYQQELLGLVKRLEELTWIKNPGEAELLLIYRIIGMSRQLHALHGVQKEKFERLHAKGVLKAETSQLISLMEDFEEAYEDLHNVFFVYPHDEELQDIFRDIADNV